MPLVVVAGPGSRYYAPAGGGGGGDLIDGQSASISGSGFGASAPTVVTWDTFNGGANGSPVTAAEIGAYSEINGVLYSNVTAWRSRARSPAHRLQSLASMPLLRSRSRVARTISMRAARSSAQQVPSTTATRVRARHTSSASYSTAVNTAITIGGVSDTFTSTTETDPSAPVYRGWGRVCMRLGIGG